jgi:hypothetical protein
VCAHVPVFLAILAILGDPRVHAGATDMSNA